jgi:mannitol-1-/sugar-/sorbitol-6-phosphatase
MIEIPCSALLFDMDGVLIDSTPAAARVWRNWALAHGFDPQEVVARAHGRPSIMTIRDYLPYADHEAENRIVERQEIEDLEGVVPLPGARELLAALPPERWTISTSATRPLAEVRLRAAGLCVPERIITATDITHGKPHPEPYLKAAAALGFAPEDCVVVEDAVAGVQSGRAAGARVIGFPSTFTAEKLKAVGAEWVIKNCSEMRLESSDLELRIGLGKRF